jgi:hypothetical protein
MTKQLLIYESARPMSAAHHGKMSLEAVSDYSFSAGINAVPLMGLEPSALPPSMRLYSPKRRTVCCRPLCWGAA